jgi:hypothetical protein
VSFIHPLSSLLENYSKVMTVRLECRFRYLVLAKKSYGKYPAINALRTKSGAFQKLN